MVAVNQSGLPLQITDGMADEAPVFLDDQTLLFNRPDTDQTPRAFTIGRDGSPVIPAIAAADNLAALQSLSGILMALPRREVPG